MTTTTTYINPSFPDTLLIVKIEGKDADWSYKFKIINHLLICLGFERG